ncbi:MAG: hypothetical protein GY851_13650 [bacterium]|nr:hypothetical protein [bacterium]
MGLTYTEILMGVEEEFGIDLDDDALQHIRTVGDLYARILGELRRAATGARCITPGTFATLRTAISHRSGVDNRDVTLDKPLKALVPLRHRRREWQAIGASTGLPLPKLRRSRALVLSVTPAYFLGLGAIGHWLWPLHLWAAVPLALAVLGGPFILWGLTRPFAVHFGRRHATMRGLLRALPQWALHPYAGGNPRNEENVWCKLQEIIVEVLHVEPSDITPDADFIDDLRAE